MIDAAEIIAVMIVGSLAGIYTAYQVRRSARRRAAQTDGEGRVLRANTWWWSFGLFVGVFVPLMFLMLHFARSPDGSGRTGVVVLSGLWALGGAVLLTRAIRYRVLFDSTRVEVRPAFGRRRSLRWSDVKSVTWSPTERIVLRGTGADSVVQVGVERGFLDFLAAVEERVPTEVRGSAVETARRAVLGEAALRG